MSLFEKLENFLFQTPVWKLILFLFLIMLFKTGIFYHPNLHYHLDVAKNPYTNFFENEGNLDLFYMSYFGSWLAQFIGATSKMSFFLFHLVFSVSFSFLFIKIIFKNFSNEIARISLILFFVFPASSTIYYIVGYDSVTIFLMALTLYFKSYIYLTFLIGILMGMQHFELSFFGSGALLLSMVIAVIIKVKSKSSILFPLSVFAGVIIGRIILNYIFEYNNMNISTERSQWYAESLPEVLYSFFFHFYDVIWFSLGLGWIIIFKFYISSDKKIYFFIPFFCMLAMLPIIPDTTRTFSVMSFLLIAYVILLNENFLKFISKKEISVVFILWTIIPYGWAWNGIARPSHLSYTIAYPLKHLFDWFDKAHINASQVWPYFYPY